jgi:hypothetical protein
MRQLGAIFYARALAPSYQLGAVVRATSLQPQRQRGGALESEPRHYIYFAMCFSITATVSSRAPRFCSAAALSRVRIANPIARC